MKILVATSNSGKIKEIREILSSQISICTPHQTGLDLDVIEDGETFRDNAVKKALSWFRETGIMTLADDSGLCVDALGGEPGVRSARYAGIGATDQQNYSLLLERMQGKVNRKAGFVCVAALVIAEDHILTAQGEYHGTILKAPVGKNGFGYDPVFYDPNAKKTFAQIDSAEKNAKSHRKRALDALKQQMQDLGL